MSSRSRWLILLVSTPLVVFAAVGGLLGASGGVAQDEFPHLKVFGQVVQRIMAYYVEPADPDKVMDGAMRGLVDSLDSSSAYLTADEVKAIDAGAPLPAGDTGITLTRQFYLRIVGVADGSPAERAGLKTGDYIRGIDGKPTRELSAPAGTRLLRGAPGSKITLTVFRGNAADPREIALVREATPATLVTSKRLPGGEAYLRIVRFQTGTTGALLDQLNALRKAGAGSAVIDVRGIAGGSVDEAIASARLFIKAGTIATKAGRATTDRTVTTAGGTDGAIALPVVVLISNGTANAAEVFAAAMAGTHRADLLGQITAGLAAEQHLVRLPDGVGLWMTYQRYLTADGQPIHERGVAPTVGVDEPFVDFGEVAPPGDPTLDKGVEHLKGKKTP